MAEARDSPARSFLSGRLRGGGGSSEFSKWMRANWSALLMLTFVFVLALFVRSYFAYETSADNGYIVSGGSDSYYWNRIIEYNAETGENLYFDPLLNYPYGGVNPRPPFYSMSVAVPAVFAEGLFESLDESVGFMFVWSTAFWGALTVIPVYFLGKETFGRRAGMAASFFFAVIPAHVQRSVLSNADHDSIILFFIVLIFYFMLRAIKAQDHRKWISSWKSVQEIKVGLKEYLSNSRTPLLYALMAGTAYAVLMMTWVGFAYVTVLILAYYVVQLLVNRFKNLDSASVTILIFVSMGFGYLLALPYYINYYDSFMEVRFLVPVYLWLGTMVFGSMFILTRDYPWTLSLPAVSGVLIVAVLGISVLYPALGEAIMTGQGYFSQSKLYTTIAEARAPLFSELALSFGMVTFFMSLAGLIWAMVKIPKRATAEFIFIVVWLAAAIFMAISAGRFMFNAAPAFALAAGWVLVLIVDALDFNSVRKSLAGASGSILIVFRKSVKIRHICGVLFLGFLVVLPNVWYSVDAGIPSETKRTYDKQIYSSIPSFMRPEGYDIVNGSNWYLGAFGYSLPLPSYYYPSAWGWFGEQDSDVYPVSSRPAYVAWWDYGFEAIQEGNHPTVADNFQNGYQMAGNIIMAQSELDAIALFSFRLILYVVGHNTASASQVVSLLEEYGIDTDRMYYIISGPSSSIIDEVLSDPDRFGPMSSDLSDTNARIVAGRVELSSIGLEPLVALYDELCEATGLEIRYFNVDSRLFPVSGSNTGIFYAPAKLSDRRLDLERGSIPYDFFVVKAVDDRGVEYDLDEVTPDMYITDYILEYQEMFYDSMFYRAMCGFSGADIGFADEGLPGVSGLIQRNQPMPGWNMTHFRVVYRTAYYNPYPSDQVPFHQDEWRAINYDEAYELQLQIQAGKASGMVDLSGTTLYRSGTVFLKYYHGAYVNGTIITEEGYPADGIRVTVQDEHGIPHHTGLTDSNGQYSLIAPFGEVRLVISDGPALNPSLVGANKVEEMRFNVSDEQAMRIPQDLDNDGILDYVITKDFVMKSSTISGDLFWDMDRDGNLTADVDEFVEDATVLVMNLRSGQTFVADAPDGSYEMLIPPGQYRVESEFMGVNGTITDLVNVSAGASVEESMKITPSVVNGFLMHPDGSPAGGIELVMDEANSDAQSVTITAEDGSFMFEKLLPGKYRMITTEPDKIVLDQFFGLTIPDTQSRNITLFDKVSVAMRVTSNGQSAAYAVYHLSNNYDKRQSVAGVADRYGWVREAVPAGDWTLYAEYSTGTGTYAGMVLIEAGSEPVVGRMELAPACDVVGGVTTAKNAVLKNEPLSIVCSDGARLQLMTTALGGFHAIIPAGSYDLIISSVTQSSVYSGELTVSSDIVGMRISMTEAVTVSGTFFLDANSDGVLTDLERAAYGRLTVTDQYGRAYLYTTNSDGFVIMVLPKGGRVTLSSPEPGYSSWSQSLLFADDVTDTAFAAMPDKVTLTGKVTCDGAGVSGVLMSFVPEVDDQETVQVISGINGVYTAVVQPSLYELVIDQPVGSDEGVRYQNESQLWLEPSGSSVVLDVELSKRVLVSGNVLGAVYNISLRLSGPEEIDVDLDLFSFSVYLVPGTYTAYARGWIGGFEHANLSSIEISETPRALDIELTRAHSLEGVIYIGASPTTKSVDVIAQSLLGLEVANRSTSSGKYSLTLPPGTYIVSFIVEDALSTTSTTYYVEYFDERVISISSGDVIVNPELSMRFDNTTLSGSVVDENGNPIVAKMQLVPNGKFGVGLTFTTGSSGAYSVGVQPGAYTVYCTRSVDKRVALYPLTISRNQPAVLDLSLELGEYLQGRQTIAGETSSEEIIVSSGDTVLRITPASDGFFNLVVPSGSYTATSSTVRTESGIPVSYGLSLDVDVGESTVYLDFELLRDTRRIIRGIWDEKMTMMVTPGQTISYVFIVENAGNIDDTYKFSFGGTDFAVSFDPSSVAVDFGATGNTANVVAGITVGESAVSGENTVKVTVRSDSQSSARTDVNLMVNVSIVRRVSVENLNESNAVNSTSSSAKFLVRNDGNADDLFVVGVSNLDVLSTMGWSASLVDSDIGEEVSEVALGPFETRELKVVFSATRSQPDPGAEATIRAYSKNQPSIEGLGAVAVMLPDLTVGPGDVDVIRDDISFEYDVSRLYLNIGLGVALASLVAMFFILRRRKGLSGGGRK